MYDTKAPLIDPNELFRKLDDFVIVDVRKADEWHAELGHIKGAKLITQGTDLEQFVKSADASDQYVFVCRSGRRSDESTTYAIKNGLKNSFNLSGGMILWNEMNLPVNKT